MNNLYNKLIQEFQKGSMLHKLIYINVGLFLVFSILGVFSFMFQFNLNPILERLYLPASGEQLATQPWTLISYMFLHNGFLHLLINMLWLHFGGKTIPTIPQLKTTIKYLYIRRN